MDTFAWQAVVAISALGATRYTRGLSPLVRAICIISLSSAATVVALAVAEVLTLGSPDVRGIFWRLTTAVLLVLLGFAFPAIYVWRLVDGSKRDAWRLALFVSFYSLVMAAFYTMARRLPMERDDLTNRMNMTYSYALRQDMLACISFVGITLMAALCGISSVSAPYTAFLYKPRTVTEADVDKLDLSISSTDELIISKELQINRLQLQLRSRAHRSSTNLVSKMIASLRPDDLQRELSSETSELNSLQKLRLDIIDDRTSALARLQSQNYAATLRGRVHAVLYALFAIYCVYRVFNGYLRLFWWLMSYESREPGSAGPRDALVVALAQGAHHVWSQFTTDNWVRIIGALMSAVVFATSTSGMLRTLVRLRRAFKRRGSSGTLSVSRVLIANFIGIYVLAVATILRLNIPKSMSGPILTALASPLRIQSVQLLNDIVLSASSTVTILALFLSSRLEDDGAFDEEEKYE